MKFFLIAIFFYFFCAHLFAQNCEYFPFYEDTSIQYISSSDTMTYRYTSVGDGCKIDVSSSRFNNELMYSNYVFIRSNQLVLVDSDKSVSIGFNINPEVGEFYPDQERKSKVSKILDSLTISERTYYSVLVQDTWYGDGKLPASLYYAKGIGLIMMVFEGEKYRVQP